MILFLKGAVSIGGDCPFEMDQVIKDRRRIPEQGYKVSHSMRLAGRVFTQAANHSRLIFD